MYNNFTPTKYTNLTNFLKGIHLSACLVPFLKGIRIESDMFGCCRLALILPLELILLEVRVCNF